MNRALPFHPVDLLDELHAGLLHHPTAGDVVDVRVGTDEGRSRLEEPCDESPERLGRGALAFEGRTDAVAGGDRARLRDGREADAANRDTVGPADTVERRVAGQL